ncbi:hypothetical protein PHAVU_003G017300, partial [Phaseolus vulgaris]
FPLFSDAHSRTFCRSQLSLNHAVALVAPMAPSRSGGDACKGGAPEFPAGLRVLVVDDDATTLRIIEQMSIRCRYRG